MLEILILFGTTVIINMHIGICKFTIHIPGSQSLKNKRRVITSLMGRIQKRFNVSVSEVDHQDNWQLSTIGITCHNTDRRQLNSILDSILGFVREYEGEYILTDNQREIIVG